MGQVLMVVFAGLTLASQAQAGGRLAATGGVTQVEGAGGGGLVPWALIAGTGTRDQLSATAFYSHVRLPSFTLQSKGVSFGLYDRYEFSYARQEIDLDEIIPDKFLSQHVLGLKVKVLGDAIVDQDVLWPQISVGVLYKSGRNYLRIPRSLGATRTSDSELYAAATKIWIDGLFGRTTLINGTLRYTRANQMGLLGFGGDKSTDKQLCLEGSAAVFIHDKWLVGGEYRQKPDNLSASKEEGAVDLFLAWVPNKYASFTLGWVSLGSIAGQSAQSGGYASLQLSY